MNTVKVGGTGGVLEIIKILASEFQRNHRDIEIRVLPSMGSSAGIKAVLAGDLDIGLSARRLNESERAAVVRPLGATPFILVTGKRNAGRGFSLKELADVYSGRDARWPDGTPIRIVLRPSSEFDTLLLKGMSREMEKAVMAALSRPGMMLAVTDQESADAIEKVPGALGTITLGQMLAEKRPYRILSVNGLEPSRDTERNNSYPYFKEYFLVLSTDPSAGAQAFNAFILSRQGKGLLTRYGYRVISP